ncbi:GNAT family N-acetyltransferase [bacterium]|nr:GNAT family N-acetyltransferase [bacterium]
MKPYYFNLEKSGLCVTVREAEKMDLAELTNIYNYYIKNSAITFDLHPFSIKERGEWFEHYNQNDLHRLFVAELEDKVIGYASSSPFRPKDAYLTSVETSIYLSPYIIGNRIGKVLYRYLFDALEGTDLHKAYAVITVPNDQSIELHRKFGFKKIGLFEEVGRKFDQYHDVEWWEKNLNEGG